MIKPLTLLSFLFPALLVPCNKQQTQTTFSGPGSDGPYVFYRNQQIQVKYVDDSNGFRTTRVENYKSSEKNSIRLNVNSDEAGITFPVFLKERLENEKTEFDADKLFVVSDLEGNFRAFRRLLQGNGIIDSAFNWTYGNGHLVLTGDFFDRGDQVTQMLWLIYSLEGKAKAAGGYVHFVLGNHEIMNLSGDVRYVHPRYKDAAAIMQEDYMTFFGNQSELGRWLRTKNIVEKVGPILFVHGGISGPVNQTRLALKRLNNLARPFYDDSLYKYPNNNVELLYSSEGPFWYRGYYQGAPVASIHQIDSTLAHYGVKHIATGHTVISDTISLLHNGKLINTDVHHAKGHSWALIVEDGKLYRTDALGQRFLMKE